VSLRDKRALGPPASVAELLERARCLEGATVGELARALQQRLAHDPSRTKGRVGELVERFLGASAGSLDLPDFPLLGVELKTIPIDRAGRVRESTHVCAIDLEQVDREEWETSRVRRKLARVLWVPIEAAPTVPITLRSFSRALLWHMDCEQEAVLRADWTDLVGRMAVGGIDEISGYNGAVLQVRPKARDSSVLAHVRGYESEPLATVPRGFYLRARFTEELLWQLSDRPSAS
jgi:DNA mismatch repair protein MutH